MSVNYVTHPSVIMREERDGALLFNKETEDIKVLNEVGLEIWKLCDGKHDIEGIVDKLTGQYSSVSRNYLMPDIVRFLELLSSHKLIVPCDCEA